MPNKPRRNRVRPSLCELCEPRQMLSVTPVIPLETQIVNQSFKWQFESNLTLGTFDANLLFKDIRSGFIALGGSSAVAIDMNTYGITSGWPAGSINMIPAFVVPAATPSGMDVRDSGLWQSVKAPQLDPISANPPGLSPVRIGVGDAGLAPRPVRSPAAVDSGDVRTSPAAPVSEHPATINMTARPVGAADAVAAPSWLSVTFTPDEQHRLDATTVDAHFEHTMASRDPKARFALQPTRVTCQTFCDPVAAPSFGQGDAAESSALPTPKPSAGDGATQPAAQSPPGATSGAIVPAIRDAAILDWETTHAAVLAAPVASTRQDQRGTGRQESSSAARGELDERNESESATNSTVAQFLDENKYLAGVLLGVLAARSLWFYGAGADAQSVGQTLKLLRKRIASAG